MNLKQSTASFLWLLVLAAIGGLLVTVPPLLVSQYQRARELGPVLGYAYLATIGVGVALLVGCGAWVVWRVWKNTSQRKKRAAARAKNPSQLSTSEKQREVEENLAAARDFQHDPNVAADVKGELQPMMSRVEEKSSSQKLEIVAFGTISSGKSSLLNALVGRDIFVTDPKGGTTMHRNEIPWPGNDRVVLVDTPGLGEISGEQRQAVAAEAAQDADLVLLVIDGPLRETESRLLTQLGQMEKRVLVCLNKQDWYDDAQRLALLGQITEQVKDTVAPDDVLAVRSRSTTRKRMRVTPDGREAKEDVAVPPDIAPLASRMMQVVKKDGRDLLLANLLLQSRGLVEDAKQKVEAALDRRAWQIVDRYTWGAGGVAAVSPFPMIDLAAGIGVSTKMVFDLARVYRQNIDIEAASQLLAQLGKQLIGVLGVSMATPAVAAAVASMLKTVPGAGTIAGGTLQGLVVAFVTRWIGAVFIQYFKAEMKNEPEGLAEIARRQWQRLTRVEELRGLIQTANRRHAEQDD